MLVENPNTAQSLGLWSSYPHILQAAGELLEDLNLYPVDVIGDGDCAMRAICESVGLSSDLCTSLRQFAVLRIAAKFAADPQGYGVQLAHSLQGPWSSLIHTSGEYLSKALKCSFSLCEAEVAEVADLLSIGIVIRRVEANKPYFERCFPEHAILENRPLVYLLHVGGNHYLSAQKLSAAGTLCPQVDLASRKEELFPTNSAAINPNQSFVENKGAGLAQRSWKLARHGHRCGHPVAPRWYKAANTGLLHGGFTYTIIKSCISKNSS